MNWQKPILLASALALMGLGAGAVGHLKAHQRLGTPGIRFAPIPGSVTVEIDLPEHVLNFSSEKVPQEKIVLDTLPKDTSYAQRLYKAPDGFWVNANIILMGADRTSIHKPEFCLPGQGWHIDERSSVVIPIQADPPYSLPVSKWVLSKSVRTPEGAQQEVRGLYVFWFVADREQTPSHWERVLWLARDLFTKGVLQRWAYVSYFCVCLPGQQDACFDRVKQLIAAGVPEFQSPPQSSAEIVRK